MSKLQEAYELRSKKINKIEKIKELKTPLSVYERLDEICSSNLEDLADEDSSYFLKCFGAFLKKDGKFMMRIRIPGGQLSCTQAAKLGEVSRIFGNDYIDITTRQQIELRYIELQDLSSVIEELDSVGISTFQTGVDNFRNIVTSSFDSLGDKSIIECKPIIDELQSIFFKKEEWIGTLPRKFNTAILGTKVNDCNIYGHDCCFVVAKKDKEIGFNLYLGGKVGVQASDSGLFVTKEQVVPTFKAITELFKQYGFRDNRNKNRLHFLLESVGMDSFVDAIKDKSSLEYKSSGDIIAKEEFTLDSSGIYKLDSDTNAYHLSIPSGVFKGSSLEKVASLCADTQSFIRLSVEQSLYIISSNDNKEKILNSDIYDEYSTYQNIYFNHQIACAGTATCAFGVIPNKSDAINMAEYLNSEVPIRDGKVRMYWSACPKGCGIHGVADIGFEGCKAKDANGESCYGVHIYLGGKATKEAKEARLLYKSVPLEDAKYLVKKLMELYKQDREPNESFENFESRVLSKLSVEEITQICDKINN
jgi:ferredoxin-nitrite reductase